MIPVFQTIISDPNNNIHGNCMGACLASIMELSINVVPKFQDMGQNWFQPFWDFLAEHGYTFHGTGKPENVEVYDKGIDGYYVVNGDSPRGFTRGHSVVYYKGKMVHDPHPEGTGLLKVRNFFMIERTENVPTN
jgi:hypothetical protein